jgi:hypothetical protein
MSSKADEKPIERSLHVESVLKRTAEKVAAIEAQTGWRILIQWGEPLWEHESPDLDAFDIILALLDQDWRGRDAWTLRVAPGVDNETLNAVRAQIPLLAKDLEQTSSEFALERFMESIGRALPVKRSHKKHHASSTL